MFEFGDNQEQATVETPAASPEVAIADPASSIAEPIDAAPEAKPAGPDLTAADAAALNDLVFGPEATDEPVTGEEVAGQRPASNRPRRDAGLLIASTLKGVGGKMLRTRQLTTAAAVWAEGSEDLGGLACADLIAADIKDLAEEFELGREFLAFLEGSGTGGLVGKLGSFGLSGFLVYQAMTKAIEADVLRIQAGQGATVEQPPA